MNTSAWFIKKHSINLIQMGHLTIRLLAHFIWRFRTLAHRPPTSNKHMNYYDVHKFVGRRIWAADSEGEDELFTRVVD